MSTLTHEQARRVYDRIGKLQDSQAFYEDRALELMLRHAELAAAGCVFEFGCGTGRLAARLLDEYLPRNATYRAVDISPTMVGLATERLAPFGARVAVQLTDGEPPIQEPTAAYDRFVSTYVLDLLADEAIAEVLQHAHRMLKPGGLLCLTSLAPGDSVGSRAVARVWSTLHRMNPSIVGGCRPLELLDYLPASEWQPRYHDRVSPFAIPSEILVAERL